MKLTSILLVGLLLSASCARHAVANTPPQSQSAARAEKVKSGVRKVGTGEDSRVEVKLLDGSKLKGYVREIGEDNFVVVEKKTGAAQTVRYEQVERLKGTGMSTGTKVAIGFAVAALTLGTLALIGLSMSD